MSGVLRWDVYPACLWVRPAETNALECLPLEITGKGAGSPAQTEVQLLKELGKAVQPQPRQDRMESLQMFVYYVLSVSPD